MGETENERRRMVERQLERRGIRHRGVLDAMMRVPRHVFLPREVRGRAYEDSALPLPDAQTMSQPYMVALMTEALDPGPDDRVLDVGTGSGYHAAVLAELVRTVYSIERHPELADDARQILEELGYGNIHVRVGDGTLGWPEEAPFDGILVAAGAPRVPQALVDQLRPDGGRLVIPIGTRAEQELYRYVLADGELREEWLTSCRFVPLLGEQGWQD